MPDALILREDRDAVATLTLNAPASLNALSVPMLRAMEAAFAALASDSSVKVVILKGAGRVFSAGHDLKEMQAARAAPDQGAAWFKDLFDLGARVMQAIPALPQPVIAQVHGLAAAAGCQLAASCDLITAAGDARFGVNGVNIGLFCSTPMVALTRKLPPAVAFEMLTTGEFLPAPHAHALGMVNRIAALEETTRTLAATLAGKLAPAVRIGKPAFYAQAGLPLDRAYALCGAAMVENMLRPDTAEGIQAFLEKRKPDWN
ncbi:enoyl-CoA hydratase [Rhodobacter sp. SGA-6-6]|uniref:enoyl-CoA hydratase n=1 Tax=Rhodobacter sp. SGA-6-6 TaxID=2710882 RepID=UPI0013EABB21|nr:enoyl-CoA hydratase [Rhodobacter sp. SGA-6-6]NGM45657.1 enoyl-CoA hydratase [Rhodobacter sp. SGA-6-6]